MPTNLTMPKKVEAYLDYLADPSGGLDTAAIADAQARADDLTNSDGARVLAKIEVAQLEHVDDSKLIADFVSGVHALSKSTGVSVEILKGFFKDTAVPDEVLTRLNGPAPASVGRKSAADIEALAAKRTDQFTIKAIVDETGAAKGTVTKGVKAAVEKGVVRELDGSPKRYCSAA